MMLKWKPLLLIIFPVLALSVVLYGLTVSGAWFSDSASSGISIITAGSLDLEVTEEIEPLAGIEPGSDFSSIGTFCNTNTGTTALKYRGLFEPDSNSAKGLIPFLTMGVEDKRGEDWTARQEISNSQENADGKTLSAYFKFPDQDVNFENAFIVAGTLAPGQRICYRLSAKLQEDIPEEFRKASLDFDLHLYATQTINPGW